MCEGSSAVILDDDGEVTYCCPDGQRRIQRHYFDLYLAVTRAGPAQAEDAPAR